ncbi:ephrin type-B receptor 1-B-like [Clytia hemisphaerica]|uniref:receptor protein-tyrosine kinase n=1 Tax=Clytia hemisphaerica TaxID=252671 RepID=A0A7M5WZU1_9CNID
MFSIKMTHRCSCILFCLYLMITSVKSVEKVLTYKVNTKTDSIWEYDDIDADGCEKIKYKRGFQLFCVDARFSCTLKSKPLILDEFKSEFFNITIENSLGGSDPCVSCSGEISGTVDLFQTYKKDSDGKIDSTRSHNFALAESVTKTIQKKPNLEYIEIWLTLSRICKQSLIVKLSSAACKPVESIKNLIDVPKDQVFPAPSKEQETNDVGLSCVDNAVVKEEPVLKCMADASYQITGSCQCNVSYEKLEDRCQKCSANSFKLDIGNGKCEQCKANSNYSEALQMCVCQGDYLRALDEKTNRNAPCYKKPVMLFSKDIYILNNKNTSVTIQMLDYGPSTTYIINLPHNVRKVANKPIFKIDHLRPNSQYNITIEVQNDVLSAIGVEIKVTKSFWTNVKKPGAVKNIRLERETILIWDPITDAGPVEYVIEMQNETLTTPNNFHSLENNMKFVSGKIHAEVNGPTGKIKGYPIAFTFTPTTPKEKNDFHLIIGGSVGGFLLILIILMIALLVKKHRKPAQFEVTRMEDGTMTIPRMTLFKTSRLYVDPTTYSHVDEAVEEFALELDRSCLTMDQLIGGGEFANVFKGILSTESRNSDVAIKVLKSGANRSDRDDFLSEAAILGQFSDPNVVSIEGVVLKDYPSLIVLEYMANGSLDKYLVKNDSQFSVAKLLGMARGVASGMKYLSDLGFIHRDLAARNVLVNSEDCCKIADFGMSRELKTDDTYDTKGGKIPIKWTAPEAIEYKKFTTASDVWSYGIVCWEIFSYGERPYWEWSNYEVMERLSTGYRLPPPMECPKGIHDLMLQCWHKDRLKRPRFSNILQKVEEWLKNPDRLTDIASVITKRDENLDYSVLDDLASWLEAINMKQYLKMFTESGYMTPKDILYLTNEDLESLGVGLIGHRKKLLKAIKNTKNQTESTNKSDTDSKASKVSRTSSFAGFGSSLSKKVSFLASPNSSISFKKTVGKRTSLGYQLQ